MDIGTVTQIEAGFYHACAIQTDGTPVCWGNYGDGQTSVPADAGTVTQITAGAYHTCAIRIDGTPVCWGYGGDGQTSVPADVSTVTQITAARTTRARSGPMARRCAVSPRAPGGRASRTERVPSPRSPP